MVLNCQRAVSAATLASVDAALVPVVWVPSQRRQRGVGLKGASLLVSGAALGILLSVSPGLSQTGINPGASSPTATTSTSAGGLGGIQDQVQQIQGFVGNYLKQFEALKGQVESAVGDYIATLGGDVSGALKNALGDLNLPDPGKLLEGLKGKNQNGQPNQEAVLHNISGILPSILKTNATAPLLADLWSQANFSTEAQKAVKADLQSIETQVKAAQQTVSAANNLAAQSTQAATQSAQLATTAGTQAQAAQKRVSTQDAIKDLNLTAGTLSSQLAGQSGQLASQSGQLSNLISLGATSVAFQGDASAKLSQVNLGVAATVSQLADMNSQMHGAEQLRIIRENALAAQTAEASAGAFHFLR